MADNDEIFIDDKSGISIEEQKEIISSINGIAEKNRKRLSEGTVRDNGSQKSIKAKKSGAGFPLAVNISAAAVLCAGAFFLFSFNGIIDTQLKTGNAVYNLTEKALIEDLRKDTAEKLAVKDREIALMTSRLEETDAGLLQLFSGNETLSADQTAARDRLLFLQNSYNEELAILREERSKILENSRSAEAPLRGLLDERSRENSAAPPEIPAVLDSAMRELERLTGGQEKISAVEDYLAGWIAVYGINTNAGEQYELAELNEMLEQTVTDMQKTIDALSSGSTGQAARLGELEETVTTLRASVSALERSSREKDITISSLEIEKENLTRINETQEQDIIRYKNQIDIINDIIQNNF